MAASLKQNSPNRRNLVEIERALDAFSRAMGGPGSSFRRSEPIGHSFLIDANPRSPSIPISPAFLAQQLAESCGCRVKVVGYDSETQAITGWLDVDNWNLDSRDIPFPQNPSAFERLPGAMATPEGLAQPVASLADIRARAVARLAQNTLKAIERKADEADPSAAHLIRSGKRPAVGSAVAAKMAQSGLATAQYGSREHGGFGGSSLAAGGSERRDSRETAAGSPAPSQPRADRNAAAELAQKLLARRAQAETTAAGILASAAQTRSALSDLSAPAPSSTLSSEFPKDSTDELMMKIAQRRKGETIEPPSDHWRASLPRAPSPSR